MGLVTLAGEVVGRSCAPLIAGKIADLKSLAAPLLMAAGCALGGTILALFLKEIAPVKTGLLAIQKDSREERIPAQRDHFRPKYSPDVWNPRENRSVLGYRFVPS
jgi:hypothetical protein